ncbi:hypothetical protein BST63_27635 [Bradyrhizobium canariense]|uniref:histidine kinase n=1 Tax=Bradyrhizobium canariense TaxID=255045 RepID=A0ABX3WYA2_9BRAD|nr:hypothetical protein BSR47_36000 [Bradyrhizobium canariense]OSJ24303.1 hypothetical protein BST63_27635 [Bradyrhizobium canariense]
MRGGEFTLYRGSGNGLSPILLVAPAGQYCTPESLKRLEHEHDLKAELDAAWAVRPLALSRHDGRMALVYEDPGGEPLDRLLGQQMDVIRFLRIAIPLTSAIGQVHARGLIHKDLKPANVLVDVAGGGVWLTGFGFASRLPREQQAAATPPEMIAGTLAYMAPEQTGRMNRSIDARSDLYSLGITLYEMLTGGLPFAAADPMGWVHCHIARKPVPPSERASAIPEMIESIILKLLAKSAEDRYQTAAGLEADLRRCLNSWKAGLTIDRFQAGVEDVPDRLLIPEKLYGREAETAKVIAAFDRVAGGGSAEFVLVSGYSGIGKSSVVNELHKTLLARGVFAMGKCDQHKRHVPFATLAQAFQSLVQRLLGRDEAELSQWRDDLQEALGPNGQLMINFIPELAAIVGEQPAVIDLSPQDMQNRFRVVFQRLLGVFARPEHPLALFLDDCQWIDAATLTLIQHLFSHPEVRHVLLIGAYRDNEIGISHPFARSLKAIRKAGARVEEILLAPLRFEHVETLVAEALRMEPDRVRPLADLVFERTGGNPFFAIQFITELNQEALIAFDADTRTWTWDLRRIAAKGITDNVADLMAGRLNRFARDTINALKRLACLGDSAKVASLALILEASEDETHTALWEATRAGLVILLNRSYAFAHDRVREAAYSLVSEDERASMHLQIGRILFSATAPEMLEEEIFEIANHFNRGAALIVGLDERLQVAGLDLLAAKRAKRSTAYASASVYLTAGRSLLPPGSWRSEYRLTFDLGLHSAECEFLTGNLDAAETRLAELEERAATLADHASTVSVAVLLHLAARQVDQAIEKSLAFLSRVGIRWSIHPTDEDVRQEYERMRSRLAGREIGSLIDMPLITDGGCLGTLDVLSELIGATDYVDKNLQDLVVLRMTDICLENGNCDASCVAYSGLAMFLGPRFGDYQIAHRFGQLAIDLVGRGLDRFKARVYAMFSCFVQVWSSPLPVMRPLMAQAFELASANGDVTFAAYSYRHLVTNSLVSGKALTEVHQEAEKSLEFLRKAGFALLPESSLAHLGLIRSLRGLRPFGHFLESEPGREPERVETRPQFATAACIEWIDKLQEHFYDQDYERANLAADQALGLLWSMRNLFEEAEYHFYGALARAAVYELGSARSRQSHMQVLLSHHAQLGIWSRDCPETFANRVSLVAAEIARLNGHELDAERLYEEAISSARAHGFTQNEGLANELAARFHSARGYATIADAYLRNARACYVRWGAAGKVQQIEQLHPHLHQGSAGPLLTATFGASLEHLDVSTVVKAYQAVSGEIELGRLIETLMRIAIEHAGAEHGLLILLTGDELRVVAKATTSNGSVEVTAREAALAPLDLPQSALYYVIRTGESVALDDACAKNLYSDDEYIRKIRPRSVLCLPIVKQTKLVGALYLENSLTPYAFTSGRVAVLELLASQAAISLENARLYSERKRAEEDLRRGEAYLTEAQRLSHTGSFGWSVTTGEIIWSDETFRIFDFDKASPVTLEMVLQRTHPGDRTFVQQIIDGAARAGMDFSLEYRLMMPDGSVKHLHAVAHSVAGASGNVEFVGAVIDVTATKCAEEALRQSQAELAHVAKLTTMGELTATIAHEVNQPLMAIVTNAQACLRWLANVEPDLEKARNAAERVIRNGHRAGDVVSSIRALVRKSPPLAAELDMNGLIQNILELLQAELSRGDVSLETDLFEGVETIVGDRVQLQQVIVNLVMNGIEAMADGQPSRRVLRVSSGLGKDGNMLVAVEDAGGGLDPATADRIFDAFFTTKRNGLGIGLSICRSIIEAHGGKLWALPRLPHGTSFQFTLPTGKKMTAACSNDA